MLVEVLVIALLMYGANPDGSANKQRADEVIHQMFDRHPEMGRVYEQDCVVRVHISPLPMSERDKAYCTYYLDSLD